jgi:hypothetical protein
MNVIRYMARATIVCAVASSGFCGGAWAISADKVSTIRDQCEISIGPDLISVVAYMPDRSRDRFCGEFPAAGRIMLTFDLVAARLRDLPIEVRLVKESNGPLSETDELAAHTVAYLEPRKYPQGAVVFDHVFTESGDYAAFITVTEDTGVRRTSKFPFSVGSAVTFYTPAMLGAVLIAGLLVAYWAHGRSRR